MRIGFRIRPGVLHMRTMRVWCLLLPGVLASAGLPVPAAAGATVLDDYLAGLHSLRLAFTQSTQDAHGHGQGEQDGELLVLRPGRFRFESHASGAAPDSGELMVADGRNVWSYDRDLAQVVVKPADAALSATPVMLLSGTADVSQSFQVSAAGERAGLTWVRVTPRVAAADFSEAQLGFAGRDLRQMIFTDKLGQQTTLVFTRSERNAPVSEAEVSFTPPAGADVIGTPQQ